MKLLSTLFFLFLSVTTLIGQTNPGSVQGNIRDNDGEALPFATVILASAADSSMVKAGYSNESGDFALTPITAGRYFLKITYTSMAPYASEAFEVQAGEQVKRPGIVLSAAGTEMETVSITAQKPLITVKPDMTVFNVEASTNAIGTNALELLRKAPGVVVDNNENLMLQGKNGVRVYIDGKPSPLSQADLAAFLKSMQSDQIESIEIITNPSAKFDAEGNAGIINIRLKKDQSLGTNANLNLGYAIGRYGKYNGGLTANHRNKKVNVFGSVNAGAGRSWNYMDLYRVQNGIEYDQRSNMERDFLNYNFKGGADFFINDQHTIGFMANGFGMNNDGDNDSYTTISDVNTGAAISSLEAYSIAEDDRINANFNLNYRFDNRKGVTWNVDADYGLFDLSTMQFQPNYYVDPETNAIQAERIFTTTAPTTIDIGTFKFDHERPLLKGKIGLGAKVSYVQTDNDFQFYDRYNGEDTLNLDRSNRFNYTENVNAAYASWQGQFGKWGVNAGLRAEQTNSLGRLTSVQVTGNDTVDRNYLNLFPSGGLTYQYTPKNSLRLNYSRRIDRPRYQDLNPFTARLDELTYQQGNPFLQPQYSNSVELSHVLNYMYSASLKYTYTSDMMTTITDTIEGSRSFITNVNLASQEVLSFYLSAPVQLTKWWSTFTNAGVYRTRNRADYGDETKEIDLARNTFNMYHQSTFKLPKDFSIELSGFYNSPSIWGANYLNQRFWGMDIGARKKLFQGRGDLKMTVSDVFHTMQWRGIQEFGGLYMDARGGWESRQFRVNFSYLFGNDKVKASRRRKTGLEDESGRAGGGGGMGR